MIAFVLSREPARGAESADAEVARLAGQLRADDIATRSAAAFALIESGAESREVFPALVEALCDDEALDCAVAARALYARPRPAADAPLLIRALTQDTKSRAAAAWELSRIGPSAGSDTQSALLAALANPDKHERNYTVVALATTGAQTRDALPALLGVLRDTGSAESQQMNYKYPRAAAAIAIGMAGPGARESVPVLAEILGEKGGWEIQRAANCFALGRIGPAGTAALPALKRAAQDASPIVRAHAAAAIQALAPAKVQAPENHVAALIRAVAEGSLRINPRFIEGLRALGEFAGAAKPAGKKGSRKVAPPVHESIALALGYLDSLSQPPSPEEIARQEKAGTFTAGVRRYVMALGGVQQGIAPVLLEALMQGEQDPRARAVRQLAALGPGAKAAIPALRAALADSDWILRREVFLALRRIEE